MKRLTILPLLASALALVTLSTTGCSVLKAKTDPSKFYLLQGMSPAPSVVSDRKSLNLDLLPVELAGYLKRKSIVLRGEGSQITMQDFHRWGEDPGDGVTRVLGENLSQMLNNTGLGSTSEARGVTDYHIEVLIFQMDGTLETGTKIVALWQISEAATGRKVAGKRSIIETPIAGAGGGLKSKNYDGYVASLSTGLGVLSQEIAQAVAKL